MLYFHPQCRSQGEAEPPPSSERANGDRGVGGAQPWESSASFSMLTSGEHSNKEKTRNNLKNIARFRPGAAAFMGDDPSAQPKVRSM